jgi:hypothetical protein
MANAYDELEEAEARLERNRKRRAAERAKLMAE